MQTTLANKIVASMAARPFMRRARHFFVLFFGIFVFFVLLLHSDNFLHEPKIQVIEGGKPDGVEVETCTIIMTGISKSGLKKRTCLCKEDNLTCDAARDWS